MNNFYMLVHTMYKIFELKSIQIYHICFSVISFVDKECQQQSNGYDCGVYVICNTELLANYAKNHGEIQLCDMTIKINPNIKRKEILNIIKNLSQTQ